MISNYLEVLILSIIQGISEFIPVSSSAHLIIFYFKKDLLNILNDKKLFNLLLNGSIPLIIVGYIFYSTGAINSFRSLNVIAWTTLIFGILMYFADTFKIKKNIEKDLTIKNILIVGILQILAIVPGVSRAGITITAGRFLNFNRHDSAKISFYLSIPALMGASILSLKDAVSKNFEFNFFLIISIILSFIFSYLTIKYFLIYTKKFSLKFFVIYRVILSIIIFSIIYF